MEVSSTVTCECNGHSRPYKDIRSHMKSEKHMRWVRENEVFDLRCRCKRLENENESLKYVIDMLKNNTTSKTKPTHERPKTPKTRTSDNGPSVQVTQ